MDQRVEISYQVSVRLTLVRRLAEWRDKEVANRLRILKITLWASVIVGVGSLLYTYIVYVVRQWGS